jgi:hypothetical protein
MTDLELSPIDLEEEAREQAAREALLAQEFRLGPLPHQGALFDLVYDSDRDAERDADLFGIRPRTMRNRLRLARTRISRRNFFWGPLRTLDELEDECDRLLELCAEAKELYHLSRRPVHWERTVISRRGERRTGCMRERRGDARLLRLLARARADLAEILLRIKQRKGVSRTGLQARSSVAALANGPGGPFYKRTKRRKSLSGRRLRLPQIVGARPVSARAALVRRAIFLARRGPVRCRGDPDCFAATLGSGFG